MLTQVKRWGNSAAIRVSSSILSETGLAVDSDINIEVKDGKIVIEPAVKTKPSIKLPFTEKALLKGLTPQTAHADEIASPSSKELEI